MSTHYTLARAGAGDLLVFLSRSSQGSNLMGTTAVHAARKWPGVRDVQVFVSELPEPVRADVAARGYRVVPVEEVVGAPLDVPLWDEELLALARRKGKNE